MLEFIGFYALLFLTFTLLWLPAVYVFDRLPSSTPEMQLMDAVLGKMAWKHMWMASAILSVYSILVMSTARVLLSWITS